MRNIRNFGKTAAQILTQIVGTCFGLLLVVFLISRFVPIDPVLAKVGGKASHAVYEAERIAMGLDLPIYQQFFRYCGKILHGDFGYSLLTANPVLQDLAAVFPATIELATIAMLLGVTIGVPLGIFSAMYQGRLFDNAMRLLCLLGNSVSIFWLALMGLLLFYAKFSLVPGPGRLGFMYADFHARSGFVLLESLYLGRFDVFLDACSHIILPAAILAYYNLANISRMTRAFMLEQLTQEYVFTARVKGLPEWYIIIFHVLRNAAIPLVTVIILSYGALLEGSTFVETIFLWPGLGYYLSQSLLNADLNATLACTLVIGVIFIGFNLLADFCYRKLDPRVNVC